MKNLFNELVLQQQEKVLRCAQRIIPHLTSDDVLQPNDFPQLENDPFFRHEEGVLEGLMMARAAYFASLTDTSL